MTITSLIKKNIPGHHLRRNLSVDLGRTMLSLLPTSWLETVAHSLFWTRLLSVRCAGEMRRPPEEQVDATPPPPALTSAAHHPPHLPGASPLRTHLVL